jgi:hypothetical protein
MKKYIFKIDEKEDRDIIDMLASIQQPFRGKFIKDALRLGIDKEKDTDIDRGLPNLAKPYCRFELVKEGLRQLMKSQAQTQVQATPINELQPFDVL